MSTQSHAKTLAALLTRNHQLREAFYAWVGTLTDCDEDHVAFMNAFDLRMLVEDMQKALLDTDSRLTMALNVIADMRSGIGPVAVIH